MLVGLNAIVFREKTGNNTNKQIDDSSIVVNKNKSFVKEQEVKGLVFKNIEASYDGESSMLSYSIVNESNETIHMGSFILTIKDKNGNEITKIDYNYDYDIKPLEDYPTSHFVSEDISNAYSIDFVVNN